jgi:ubiquinone/menaquinone biosynthesis C-methylase UbiE
MKKLHLGCGTDRRAGWVNIDANKNVHPDIVTSVDKLPMFKNNSVEIIEACHLFEHFTYLQALDALTEWHRILCINGKLFLELPDFDECIKMLGKYKDPNGYDLGLVGVYGHPPMVKTDGLAQTHKWGWTKETLSSKLRETGFSRIEVLPITQTWRVAAKTNRDFRIKAEKTK